MTDHDVRTTLDQVYSRLATRRLSDYLPAYRIAREAVAEAQGHELLALHEAIVQSLDKLLSDLGEHGRQNVALIGASEPEIDIRAWTAECEASWRQVQALRAQGFDSGPLIAEYVRDQIYPIGSRPWLNGMRLGVLHRQQPDWIGNLAARFETG